MTISTIEPDHPSPAMLTQDTDSWASMLPAVVDLARNVSDTEFVPRDLRGRPAAVAAAMLAGREIGLPPMTALMVTHVIEGRPGLSAEGMRAMVFAAGHQIEFVESTNATCTIRGKRRYQERWTEVTWDLDQARQAGLINRRGPWQTYRRTQLQARATTELCRMIFPDVIHGFRSVEELQDMGEELAALPASKGERATVSRASARRKKQPAADRSPGTAVPSEAADPLPPPLPGDAAHAEDLAEDGSVPVDGRGGDGAPDAALASETASPTPAAPSEDAPLPDPELPEPEVSEPPTETTEEDPTPRGPNDPATDGQKRGLHGYFNTLGLRGLTDRPERLRIAGGVIGRPIATTNDLTVAEASALLDTLSRVRDADALRELLAQIDAAEAEEQGQ